MRFYKSFTALIVMVSLGCSASRSQTYQAVQNGQPNSPAAQPSVSQGTGILPTMKATPVSYKSSSDSNIGLSPIPSIPAADEGSTVTAGGSLPPAPSF